MKGNGAQPEKNGFSTRRRNRFKVVYFAGLWTVSNGLGSSPSIRFITTGRVDGAFVFHARLKEICQQPEGPVRADACPGCGLFERDTAVPERKGYKKEHGWVLVSKSLTLPPAPPSVGEVI